MSNPLPQTNQCPRCKEWFHTVHVCSKDINVMPINCTTATLCRKHGCHGECLPTPPAAPAYVPLNDTQINSVPFHGYTPASMRGMSENDALLLFAREVEALVVARMRGEK